MTTTPGTAGTNVCPACGQANRLLLQSQKKTVEIRREAFDVEASCVHCQACGQEFEGAGATDYMAEAYRLYREKHGLPPTAAVNATRAAFTDPSDRGPKENR
jgi:hypothetical protein